MTSIIIQTSKKMESNNPFRSDRPWYENCPEEYASYTKCIFPKIFSPHSFKSALPSLHPSSLQDMYSDQELSMNSPDRRNSSSGSASVPPYYLNPGYLLPYLCHAVCQYQTESLSLPPINLACKSSNICHINQYWNHAREFS